MTEVIERLARQVNGKNDSQNIMAFTLSTCQWCKKAKRYLNNNEVKYRYIDVDTIDPMEKAKILNYLRENFPDQRISYPFIICDGEAIVGYNPNKYEEVMGK
ncbi:MAG: glutaredoxin family protein [Candidatus Lokiarchaeota archaeon]